MKKKILVGILFAMFIVFISKIYADGIQKEYSAEYKRYLELSDEEKSKIYAIPEKYDVTYEEFIEQYNKNKENQENNNEKSIVNTTNLPEKYDLREYIDLPVDNQGNIGWCWAYSSLNCAESNYLLNNKKNGVTGINLAEYHLAYSRVKEFGGWIDMTLEQAYTSSSEGGKAGGSFSTFEYYLYNGYGPVKGSNSDNKKYTNKIEILNKLKSQTPCMRVTRTIVYPTIRKVYDNSGKVISNNLSYSQLEDIRKKIKQHIMNNGSLYTITNLDSEYKAKYFNKEKFSYYIPEKDYYTTHAVSIVGWDDNYPKENFVIQPKNDGAYIVQNSWGTDWGDKGYYYVSYDDACIEKCLSGVVEIVKYNDPPVVTVDTNAGYSLKEEKTMVLLYSNQKLKDMDKLGWSIYSKDYHSSYTTYVKYYTKDTTENFNVAPMYGNESSTTSVKFTVNAEDLSLNSTKLTLDMSGKKQETLKIEYNGKDFEYSGDGIFWKSSNTKVATVSDYGVVTAKSNGICDITASFLHFDEESGELKERKNFIM